MEENMESERYEINGTVEFRIKDFCTATKMVEKYQMYHSKQCDASFRASAYPNGLNKKTAGWVMILLGLDGKQRGIDNKTYSLSWTVSIIDIEGNFRFPQSFQKSSVKGDAVDAKYLEKSFILNKKEELLSDGALLLRCDFRLEFKKKKMVRMLGVGYSKISLIPDEGFRIRNMQDSERPSVFVGFSQTSRESEEYISDDEKCIWLFETSDDKFYISLKDSLGSRLVSSSPVIRRCINSDMKEKHEKRIHLTKVKSRTFESVLYFLENGQLCSDEYRDNKKVYRFSHFYGMEELQKKCAEHLVGMIKTDSALLKKVETLADLYSDDYLSTLLESLQEEPGGLHSNTGHEKPDFDFYN